MTRFALLVTGITALGLAPVSADAQERHAFVSWSAETPTTPGLSSARVLEPTDSVRQKVGYRHWEGAAIGGGVGAVAGLLLALAARRGCSDCPSDPSVASTTFVSAGVVGAFGFLVGLASPKYRWVPNTAVPAP